MPGMDCGNLRSTVAARELITVPLNSDSDREEKKSEIPWDVAGPVVPGCLLLGMGIGFLIDELVAGLFIGLGVGIILMTLLTVLMRERSGK